ncbi:MAG: FadR family transcriptional regulator [Comamonadaceae bacterium]|nr:MAG: FadR family transcriptional regulator [Comamonadaceae bacterium]
MTSNDMTNKGTGWDFLNQAVDAAPSRLGDVLLEHLTQAIVDGRFQPGDPLPPEGQLATAFKVSKPVAREALRELAALGVVSVQQGKVSRVRAIDGAPLQRFYRLALGSGQQRWLEAVQLRRILESPIARLAAQHRTESELLELQGVLAAMDHARGHVERWIEADLEFHHLLARMTRNRLLVLQISGLQPLVRDMMQRFNARQTQAGRNWDQTFERHLRIAVAIRASDAAAAEAAMDTHFGAAEKSVDEIFGATPGAAPTSSEPASAPHADPLR